MSGSRTITSAAHSLPVNTDFSSVTHVRRVSSAAHVRLTSSVASAAHVQLTASVASAALVQLMSAIHLIHPSPLCSPSSQHRLLQSPTSGSSYQPLAFCSPLRSHQPPMSSSCLPCISFTLLLFAVLSSQHRLLFSHLRPARPTSRPCPAHVIGRTSRPCPAHVIGRTSRPCPAHVIGRTSRPCPAHVIGRTSRPCPAHVIGRTSRPCPAHVIGRTSRPCPAHVIGRTSRPCPAHVIGRISRPCPAHRSPLI
ncbi:hypothetical protein WMY93_005872 [Mugilogobius chulae]|uniref:Uncharacterized protein n=1 Tax=Mugilogobius chulae TaxID=88201 RepID=A0AAW0PRY0_9GOBI